MDTARIETPRSPAQGPVPLQTLLTSLQGLRHRLILDTTVFYPRTSPDIVTILSDIRNLGEIKDTSFLPEICQSARILLAYLTQSHHTTVPPQVITETGYFFAICREKLQYFSGQAKRVRGSKSRDRISERSRTNLDHLNSLVYAQQQILQKLHHARFRPADADAYQALFACVNAVRDCFTFERARVPRTATKERAAPSRNPVRSTLPDDLQTDNHLAAASLYSVLVDNTPTFLISDDTGITHVTRDAIDVLRDTARFPRPERSPLIDRLARTPLFVYQPSNESHQDRQLHYMSTAPHEWRYLRRDADLPRLAHTLENVVTMLSICVPSASKEHQRTSANIL